MPAGLPLLAPEFRAGSERTGHFRLPVILLFPSRELYSIKENGRRELYRRRMDGTGVSGEIGILFQRPGLSGRGEAGGGVECGAAPARPDHGAAPARLRGAGDHHRRQRRAGGGRRRVRGEPRGCVPDSGQRGALLSGTQPGEHDQCPVRSGEAAAAVRLAAAAAGVQCDLRIGAFGA